MEVGCRAGDRLLLRRFMRCVKQGEDVRQVHAESAEERLDFSGVELSAVEGHLLASIFAAHPTLTEVDLSCGHCHIQWYGEMTRHDDYQDFGADETAIRAVQIAARDHRPEPIRLLGGGVGSWSRYQNGSYGDRHAPRMEHIGGKEAVERLEAEGLGPYAEGGRLPKPLRK